MADTFDDERRDARATGRRRDMARLWWRTCRGVAALAPSEHAHVLRRDARYAKSWATCDCLSGR